jgi:hypothetical protein
MTQAYICFQVGGKKTKFSENVRRGPNRDLLVLLDFLLREITKSDNSLAIQRTRLQVVSFVMCLYCSN